MSVSKALFVGILQAMRSNYNGASVTIEVCNGGTCKRGDGRITLSTRMISVSGSVNIDTAPFSVSTLRVLSGGQTLAEITGVNVVISASGSYNITITEHYEYQLPREIAVSGVGGTVLVWVVTRGTAFVNSLLSGSLTGQFVVEFYEDGVMHDRDASPQVQFTPSTNVAVTESITARTMKQFRLCRVVVKKDGVDVMEIRARDANQCTQINAGQIAITATTFVKS